MDRRDDLPDLIGRLAGDMTSFIEAKLGLLKLEAEIELRARARRALLYVAGVALALTAFLIASMAAGYGVASLLASRIAGDDARRAAAFAIVALAELAVAVAVVWAARRIAAARSARTRAPASTASPAERSLVIREEKSS
jgi:uncharacterized membrane protein YqjE